MKQMVWLLSITLLATGCVSEQATPYEYRIPLARNSRGEEAARACATSCDGMYPEGSDGFFECLQTCPDARVVEGASCTDERGDRPPESYCYTRYVAEESGDAKMNRIVASLFAKIAGAAISALIHSGEHAAHESAHHNEHRHHRR